MLAFAAGAVNVGALLACQRFVTHVTGSATQIGVHFARGWLLLDYTIVILCFIAGAMGAALFIDGRANRGKRPWYSLPLVLDVLVLCGVAVAGHLGAFGEFGGSVEHLSDFVLLSVLGFAMGMQNAAVATSTGMAVRTTHLTGPATDLGVSVATALTAANDADRSWAWRGAALRGSKILSFTLGGAAMAPLCLRLGYLAFLVPAGLVCVATVVSFLTVDAPRPDGRPLSPAPSR